MHTAPFTLETTPVDIKETYWIPDIKPLIGDIAAKSRDVARALVAQCKRDG
jgi:hypothetical protein